MERRKVTRKELQDAIYQGMGQTIESKKTVGIPISAYKN
jgi:hypothetical protein